jgi:flagellar FliL protein
MRAYSVKLGDRGMAADNSKSDVVETARQTASDQSKQLRALLGLGAIVFIVGGISVAYFAGAFDPLLRAANDKVELMDFETASGPQDTVMELPEMLVNLDALNGVGAFLKLKVSLELRSKADVASVERVLPRLLDEFNIYLSRMRVDEIKNGNGLHRVRAELKNRATQTVGPIVNDVLFAEINIKS